MVLKGEVLARAQELFDEGRSVPEVRKELSVLGNTAEGDPRGTIAAG